MVVEEVLSVVVVVRTVESVVVELVFAVVVPAGGVPGIHCEYPFRSVYTR